MRRFTLCLAVLALGCAMLGRAEAGHLFSEGGKPNAQLLPGQTIGFSFDEIFSEGPTALELFEMELYFDASGPSSDAWSSGDALRFTMNGVSVDFDYASNPISGTDVFGNEFLAASFAPPSAEFSAFSNFLAVDNSFTLQVQSGDGALFVGFELRDSNGSEVFITGGSVDLFSPVPEPSTLLLLGTGLLGLVGYSRRKRRV